mmetsp:Transcript_8776/g.19477  ORF Transcript_8776/g.19477 Transcript_8776/m.19477 type:complete len:124 (+) Transcript_8776:64-435(+)
MARANSPVLGFACVALVICSIKVMCPSFVAPRPVQPEHLRPTAVVQSKELQVAPVEIAELTPAAVKSAALSTAFALLAEPAFAAEPGSYDIREEQARNFMVLFSIGSFVVAAGVVFVISKLYE